MNGPDCNTLSRNDEVSNATTVAKIAAKALQKQRKLLKPPPKFTVTYSRLCDGGTQEMSTAVGCVREIFPDATIRTNRRGPHEDIGVSNPSVIISGNSHRSNHADETLWSSNQRNLYQKYPKKRRRSMKEIKRALKAFKTALETDLENDDADDDATATTTPPTSEEFMANTTTTTTTTTTAAVAATEEPLMEVAASTEQDGTCSTGTCPCR